MDSISTIDVFEYKVVLKNISKFKSSMKILCNAGTVAVNQMGDLEGYGEIWYHPESIEKILLLCNTQHKFRVKYDRIDSKKFIFNQQDGITWNFKPTAKGFYAYQVNFKKLAPPESPVATLLQTVEENNTSFTKQDIKKADKSSLVVPLIGPLRLLLKVIYLATVPPDLMTYGILKIYLVRTWNP